MRTQTEIQMEINDCEVKLRALKNEQYRMNEIEDIRSGDVFTWPVNGEKLMIIEDCNDNYVFGGHDGKPLRLFSNFPKEKKYIIDYLIRQGYRFVKNINVSF
jgi:hypothetical protein